MPFVRYAKTPGQVMIRWSVQKGYITIPKSLRPERITENCQVFDWQLSQQDMDLLVKAVTCYHDYAVHP